MGNHILVLEGPLSQGLTGDLVQAGWPARAIAHVAHLLQQKRTGDLLIIDTQTPNVTPDLCHLLTTQSEATILFVTPKSQTSLAPATLPASAYQPLCYQSLGRQASADWLAQTSVPVVEVGGLCIDLPGWRITVDGDPVVLSSTEFRFLAYLAQQIGKVATYDDLLEQVWSYCPQTGDRKVITNCVKRLRHKLNSNAACPQYIVAMPGVGYRLRNQRQWIEEYSPNLVL
ncbi:MAG: winged helix-turn-helix domain-containing protein [Chloroflexota bacterium]|nr:winged helix-turn-helix domain-containing protein [Chloroflexota bacterium]